MTSPHSPEPSPMTVRLAKILMSAMLAAFAGIVTFDNLADYGSNYLFVQHVLSMDTTFPNNALLYRATTDPMWWQVSYGLIIGGEAVTCLLLLAGSLALWRKRHASSAAFNRAKAWVVA